MNPKKSNGFNLIKESCIESFQNIKGNRSKILIPASCMIIVQIIFGMLSAKQMLSNGQPKQNNITDDAMFVTNSGLDIHSLVTQILLIIITSAFFLQILKACLHITRKEQYTTKTGIENFKTPYPIITFIIINLINYGVLNLLAPSNDLNFQMTAILLLIPTTLWSTMLVIALTRVADGEHSPLLALSFAVKKLLFLPPTSYLIRLPRDSVSICSYCYYCYDNYIHTCFCSSALY